jgi:hypothetical protein
VVKSSKTSKASKPAPAAPVKSSPPALERVAAPSVHGRKPRKLSASDNALIHSVLQRAENVHQSLESTWVEFGRWIFAQVFGEDSTAAIDHAQDNPVYAELLWLADGPRLRIRPDEFHRCVLCAAYDKRLNNDAWRALDFGRKWRLLRLQDDKLLRKAAQHVLSSNLDTRGVETYVRNVLSELGEPVETRVNLQALTNQLQRVTERVTSDAFLARLGAAARHLEGAQRTRVLAQVDAARSALDVLHKRLRAAK